MKTEFILLAQYGQAMIPAETVRKDYFPHIGTEKHFTSQCESGKIKLPVIRVAGSQKTHKAVHIGDLAKYIDAQREAAQKELEQMTCRA